MIFDNLEINNFRGIKDLSIKNIKRINLLLGKNNCGKSSVLDAIFLLSGFSNPILNYRINQYRDYNQFKEEDLVLNFYNMDFSNAINISGHMYDHTKRNLKINPFISNSKYLSPNENVSSQSIFNKEDTNRSGLSMNFSYTTVDGIYKEGRSTIIIDNQQLANNVEINKSTGYEETIIGMYLNPHIDLNSFIDDLNRIIEKKQDHLIIEVLKEIEPKINSISVSGKGINVDIGLPRLIPINLLGDGIRKILSIIISMYNCKNGIVLIDEIDNGMHFSSLSSLWKTIIKTSEKFNIQIFATTHNLESLKSLNEILSNGNDLSSYQNDLMCYTLRRLDNDLLKAYEYPYENFQFVIKEDIEIR